MESDDISEETTLVFKGIDGAEAESFIRSVQRIARTAGRTRDNEWIADLVSTCITGEALRWYVELDDDTHNDWKLLRKAMLRQYPSPTQPSAPSSLSGIPVPAAAATPPSPLSSNQSTQAPKAIYRIRLYFADEEPESKFFLSTGDEAEVCLTKDYARALNVRWTSRNGLRMMENGVETQRKMGLAWYLGRSDEDRLDKTVNFACICISDSGGDLPPIDGYRGPTCIVDWITDKDGWLQSSSYIDRTQYQHQYYAAAAEGSAIRVCLLPGLEHWGIASSWCFTMKLEPV